MVGKTRDHLLNIYGLFSHSASLVSGATRENILQIPAASADDAQRMEVKKKTKKKCAFEKKLRRVISYKSLEVFQRVNGWQPDFSFMRWMGIKSF